MHAIQFLHSFDEARAEANLVGRRILVYFTNDSCGWCRVLEQRTFTDAQVVDLSKDYVCVEVNTQRDGRIADEFRIDSVPRSYVLSVEGRIIDKCVGYLPAPEYASWLRAARTKTPGSLEEVDERTVPAPLPVGAPAQEADLIIWFVDATEGIQQWIDKDLMGHFHLLCLLRAAGFNPRIEHIPREAFPSRWERANASGQSPDVITANRLAGMVRQLEREGRLIHFVSERLTWIPEAASCLDFARRLTFLVSGPRDEGAASRIAKLLLEPAPETTLPGQDLVNAEGRDEAVMLARNAAVAFVSGDAKSLTEVASESSPQLSRCTEPEEFRLGLAVDVDAVEVRGNANLALARVELRFHSQKLIGGDAFFVVLRRESVGWKALAITNDAYCMRELLTFCHLRLRPRGCQPPPPRPKLSLPADGGMINIDGKSFAWAIDGVSEGLVAQVCQVLLNSRQGYSWPDTRLRVFPGEPRVLSLPANEDELTGVSAEQMSWCVWSIGQDGQISISEVRNYKIAMKGQI